MDNDKPTETKSEVGSVKKLSANETIALLVNAVNSDNKESFYKTVQQYQTTLSPSGEMYFRIRRLLNEKPKQFAQLSELSSEIKKLVIHKEMGDEYVFLNPIVESFINDILVEWKNADLFMFHNLGVRNKILLHGPTGNGKTTIARHIARLSGLPFIEVNADLVIDSRIGTTGTNIHNIFNHIKFPCVLFWDEVDTIGRARGRGNDSAAGMENERMLNSVLVNIEKLKNDVIFIGATNRRDVLDTAFLRRFDAQLELSNPTMDEKDLFARKLIEYYKLPLATYDTTSFSNFSDIRLDLIEYARKHVLSEILSRTKE